jgi:photosystem II stability/assembly factor-like uncharacterized protein
MKALFLTLSVILVLFINSCKKSDQSPDPGPDPIPTPKPDTLSTGWKKITITGVNIFSDIFFNNNSTGYLVGDKSYKSVDGGLNWNVISGTDFFNIAVTNNGNVFFVTNTQGVIYKSTDGGNTLTPFTIPSGPYQDIFFSDNSNGYFIGGSDLYNTTDGGVNWTAVNTTGLSNTGGSLPSLFFTNSNTGWIVNGANVYKTNGSIQNWVAASFTGAAPTGVFQSVYVTPNNNVYVSNSAGEFFKSIDGGASFSKLKTFPNAPPYCDIHFVDNNTGYIGVGKKIYKTTDAGVTWNVVVALGGASLSELHFTDASHGWACGNNGTVLIFN